MICSKGLHEMSPDNTVDRTHFGKGMSCLACFRDAYKDALPPVPPGHRVVGWLLVDANGIAVESFKRLIDFTDAYSRRTRDDGRVYQGPPDGYQLRRVTEPRWVA